MFPDELSRFLQCSWVGDTRAGRVAKSKEPKAALKEKSDLLPLREIRAFWRLEIASNEMGIAPALRTPHRECSRIVVALERLPTVKTHVRIQVRRKRSFFPGGFHVTKESIGATANVPSSAASARARNVR